MLRCSGTCLSAWAEEVGSRRCDGTSFLSSWALFSRKSCRCYDRSMALSSAGVPTASPHLGRVPLGMLDGRGSIFCGGVASSRTSWMRVIPLLSSGSIYKSVDHSGMRSKQVGFRLMRVQSRHTWKSGLR